MASAQRQALNLLGSPLQPPLPMWSYPYLASLLLTAGLGLTSYFFVYQVRSTKFSKKLGAEASLAGGASLLLGLGSFFLLLTCGVFV